MAAPSLDTIVSYGKQNGKTPREIAEAVHSWRKDALTEGREVAGDHSEKYWKGSEQVERDAQLALTGLNEANRQKMFTELLPDDSEQANFLYQLHSYGGKLPNDAPESWRKTEDALVKAGEDPVFQGAKGFRGKIEQGNTKLGEYEIRQTPDGEYEAWIKPSYGGTPMFRRFSVDRAKMAGEAKSKLDEAMTAEAVDDEEEAIRELRRRDPTPITDPVTGKELPRGPGGDDPVTDEDVHAFRQAQAELINERTQPEKARLNYLRNAPIEHLVHENVIDTLRKDKEFLSTIPENRAQQFTTRPIRQLYASLENAATGISDMVSGKTSTADKATGRENYINQQSPGMMRSRFETNDDSISDAISSGVESLATLYGPAGVLKATGLGAKLVSIGGKAAEAFAATGEASGKLIASALKLNPGAAAGWSNLFTSAYGANYGAALQEAEALEATDPERAKKIRSMAQFSSMANAVFEIASERIFKNEQKIFRGQKFGLLEAALMPVQEAVEEVAGSIGQNVTGVVADTGRESESLVKSAKGGFYGGLPFTAFAAVRGRHAKTSAGGATATVTPESSVELVHETAENIAADAPQTADALTQIANEEALDPVTPAPAKAPSTDLKTERKASRQRAEERDRARREFLAERGLPPLAEDTSAEAEQYRSDQAAMEAAVADPQVSQTPLPTEQTDEQSQTEPEQVAPVEAGSETGTEVSPVETAPVAAFHTSPHLFDAVDLSREGTGEGAQAFGPGFYASEIPEIAGEGGHYQKQFQNSHGQAHVYNVQIDSPAEQTILGNSPMQQQSKTVQKAFRDLGITWNEGSDMRIENQGGQWVIVDENGNVKRETTEDLAESDLALEQQGNPLMRGMDARQALADKLGSDKAANDALIEKGIGAMRYNEGSIEGVGRGNKAQKNWVVFDPSKATVEKASTSAQETQSPAGETVPASGESVRSSGDLYAEPPELQPAPTDVVEPDSAKEPAVESKVKPEKRKAKTAPAAISQKFGDEHAALQEELAAMPKVRGKSMLDEVNRLRANGVTKFAGRVGKVVQRMQEIEDEHSEEPFVWTAEENEDDPTDPEGEAIAGAMGGAVLHPNTAPGAPIVPVKSISQIIRDLSHGLGIPIRFGRLTSARFSGYFKRIQNLIAARKANDLQVISHEVGHKLDAVFDFSSNPGISAELMALGSPATPGSLSSWTRGKGRKYRLEEGLGEFVRYWLTDPAKATAMAPGTEAYFDSVLDTNPDFGDVMRNGRDDVQLWKNAAPQARVRSAIVSGSGPTVKRSLMAMTRDFLAWLNVSTIDDLAPLRKAVKAAEAAGTKLAPSDDPYILARLLRGSYGMADTFINKGVVDFASREVTPGTSLEDALKPIAGRMMDFRDWIVAKRAKELHSQGRETGLVASDVDSVAAQFDGDADFQKAFADVKAWQDAILQYAVDAGYVSDESADAMRNMNQDYVPFHRLFEIGANERPSEDSAGTGRGLQAGKAGSFKRLVGSSRDIIDPIETMMRNAYTIVTASEKSNINTKIGQLADKPDMGRWVERIATPKNEVKVVVGKIRKQLEAAGANLSGVSDSTLLKFYQNSQTAPFGENVIKVTTSGGEPVFYRLNKDLYETIKGLDHEMVALWLKILASPAQLLRAGVTLDPAFQGSNIFRDAFGSAVINKHGMLPFQAAATGMMAMFKNPNIVAEWAASGGAQSFESAYFDRDQMAKLVAKKLGKDVSLARQFHYGLNPLKYPMLLRALSGVGESVTRVGEFKKSYETYIKQGMTTGDARRLAAFESRDRQDFAKKGKRTAGLARIAAFWNAGLQGNVALLKAFKERPIRSTLQALAYITLPTMALMAVNKDDDDYWERPQWERDLFWLIPYRKDANGKTGFIRLPKPFLLGTIFGALPERMAASQRGKKNAWNDFDATVRGNTVPNPVPNAFLWAIETMAGEQGYSFFRDSPIVPNNLKGLPPEFQMNDQNSETAKLIGKTLGYSPLKIDYIISSLTGGLGKQIVHNGIDRVITAITGQEKTAENVGPFGRFFTTPAGINSQSVNDFYDEIEKLRREKKGEKVGGKTMDSDDRRKLIRMERATKIMSRLRKTATATKDPAAKQRIYLRIVDLAKGATATPDEQKDTESDDD